MPVAGAVEINQQEHQAFLDSLPVVVPAEPRDIYAELDQLTAELKTKGVIDA